MGHSAAQQIRFADDLPDIVDPDWERIYSAKSTQIRHCAVLPDKSMSGLIAGEFRRPDYLAAVVDHDRALVSIAADRTAESAEGNHFAVIPKERLESGNACSSIWCSVRIRHSRHLSALVNGKREGVRASQCA